MSTAFAEAAFTPRINVLLSPHQNAFFAELADVVVAELSAMGIESRIIDEPQLVTPDRRDVFVLLPPHEWITIEGDASALLTIFGNMETFTPGFAIVEP